MLLKVQYNDKKGILSYIPAPDKLNYNTGTY
jgi:hypothetical protein